MTVENNTLSKNEFIAKNIASFKRRMGGELKPCNGCEFFDEIILCAQPKGILLNQDGKPVCPINVTRVVELTINS